MGVVYVNINEDLFQLVDGLLLGDAYVCLERRKNGPFFSRLGISQCVAAEEWIRRLQKDFLSFGVTTSITTRPARTRILDGRKINGSPSLTLRTNRHHFWTEQRNRWYPGGSKIVPSDVRLGRVSIENWFWGDGSLTSKQRALTLCTNGFTEQEVRWLSKRLFDSYGLNFVPTKQKQYFRLQIYSAGARRLRDILLPNCPSCFLHKLNLVEPLQAVD